MDPITTIVGVKSTLDDNILNKHVSLIDRIHKDDEEFESGILLLRGLEIGYGLKVDIVPSDSAYFGDNKIVLSFDSDAFFDIYDNGNGTSLIDSISGNSIVFKTLLPGTNISFVDQNGSIVINAKTIGENNYGINLGNYTQNTATVYAGKQDQALNFRRIIGGSGISLIQDDSTITINVAIPPGVVTGASNSGQGIQVFKGVNNTGLLQFRSLISGNNIILTQFGDTIKLDSITNIDATNRGVNGCEIFADKVGNEFQFRRLIPGSGITLTQTAETIQIDSILPQVYQGENLGPKNDDGFVIYAGMDNNNLMFKKLYAGPNITIVDSGCGLMIASGNVYTKPSTIPAGINDGMNTGTGYEIYAGKTADNIMKFKTLIPTGGTQIVDNGKQLEINAAGEVNTISNVGSGIGIYKNKINANLILKSLATDGSIQIDEENDTLIFSVKLSNLSMMIGDPSDGSQWNDPRYTGCRKPAIRNWTSSTTIADALNQLNKMLGLILPPEPKDLSECTLTILNSINNVSNIPIFLASDVINNTNENINLTNISTNVVFNSTITTNTVENFGSGNSGTLSVLFNNEQIGYKNLTMASDVGSYGYLHITDDSDYPIDHPCIWRALTAFAQGTVPSGLSSIQMAHSESGETNKLYFVYETLNNPEINNIVIKEQTKSIKYSSSVPHYGDGTELSISGIASNLSGQTYLAENIIGLYSNPLIGSNLFFGPGDISLPIVLPSNFTNFVMDEVYYPLLGDIHTIAKLGVTVANPVGSTNVLSDTLINVMLGSPVLDINAPVIENNILVDNLGSIPTNADINAKRVVMSNGDTPSDDLTNMLVANWDSSSQLTNWDAAVVNGILRNDLTDYSQYMPSGPNLSGRFDTQYITFMFRRSAVSNMSINVTGKYSGCWIKLPGLTNIPNAPNGWWDAFKTYEFGVPGGPGVSNGCASGMAMNGLTGSYRFTFGATSSSFSSNNCIFVRFKLNSSTNDMITHLTFSR